VVVVLLLLVLVVWTGPRSMAAETRVSRLPPPRGDDDVMAEDILM